MRNWNMSIASWKNSKLKASRLPMRNWNACWSIRKPELRCALPDYLWGIETSHRWTSQASMRVLPDYLWGIETLELIKLIGIICGALPDYLWGIETFSEERHFGNNLRLPDYLWGIETPVRWVCLLHENVSLPDYLWGIETIRSNPSSFGKLLLPDYLWGIETRLWVDSRYYSGRLPDYLWGIETYQDTCFFTFKPPCFQTTYEELKPARGNGKKWRN